MEKLKLAITEEVNKNTSKIDMMDTIDILKHINEEDKTVALAVERELEDIAKAVDQIAARLKAGGRLFYFGAGTSGRLGVLDASECPPTFGVDSELVTGIIAGGDVALRDAVEGMEDDKDQGYEDAKEAGVSEKDAVIGISASGGAPYVKGVLDLALDMGALAIAMSNVKEPYIGQDANIVISPVTGPEVIAGSTRLKAGTSQKMVLNMISTGVMIKLGKTYGNLMVDVRPTNIKLRKRAVNIVRLATDVTEEVALLKLDESDWNPKLAIIMILTNSDIGEARERLESAEGFVSKAIL